MKLQYLFTSLVLFIILMSSACGSGPSLTRATGVAYEIVVVMDNSQWEGAAGEAIQADLRSYIPGLPTPEQAFRITYTNPQQFSGLFTYVRNILIVRIDENMYTKVSISSETNRWARGQMVMNITAPDSESLVEWLNDHPVYITNYFSKIERDRTIDYLQDHYSTTVMDNVKAKFNVSLKVPTDMTYTRNGTDFFWASNNANTGRTDVIVYSFPYTDKDTFTKEYLVAKRDSVLKENLPGSFPNSYMATETRVDLTYTPISVRGNYTGELRGLWKMVGDMMGGPFVSHARLDPINGRVIVAEGFVFAPETDKKNFIRRIESALYTLEVPGDVNE